MFTLSADFMLFWLFSFHTNIQYNLSKQTSATLSYTVFLIIVQVYSAVENQMFKLISPILILVELSRCVQCVFYRQKLKISSIFNNEKICFMLLLVCFVKLQRKKYLSAVHLMEVKLQLIHVDENGGWLIQRNSNTLMLARSKMSNAVTSVRKNTQNNIQSAFHFILSNLHPVNSHLAHFPCVISLADSLANG